MRPKLVRESMSDIELASLVVSRSRHVAKEAWDLLSTRNPGWGVWSYLALNAKTRMLRDEAISKLAGLSDAPKGRLRDAVKHASPGLRRSLMPIVLSP
jgi:hypothetical protein